MIVKKITGLLLIASMILSGCQFQPPASNNNHNIQSTHYQDNYDFSTLKQEVGNVPKNSLFFYVNGSDKAKAKIETLIAQASTLYKELDPPQEDLMALEMAKMGIFGALNDFEYAAFSVKLKKADWTDAELEKLIQIIEEEQTQEMLQIANESLCITAAIKTKSPSLENFINQHRAEFPPFLKHETKNKSQTFMMFGCDETDLKNGSNLQESISA